MKYSQLTGAIIALLVIATCYLPWMQVPVTQKVITGMNNMGTNFGKPAKLNIIFCVIAIGLFSIQRLWAKRTNLIICALGLAWAFRNFLLYSRCEMGTCPERKYGLYLLLIGSICMLAAALLPDIKVKSSTKNMAGDEPATLTKEKGASA